VLKKNTLLKIVILSASFARRISDDASVLNAAGAAFLQCTRQFLVEKPGDGD
jgi:hypothetical protein